MIHNGYAIYNDVDAFCNRELRRIQKHYFMDCHTKYFRASCGFDIETTRIKEQAFMYHWQFSFNKCVIVGRNWESFEHLIERLNTWLEWQKATLLVWVANLGHEFSFLGRRFSWVNIFATDSHTPLKAKTGKIEFRECLTISGQGGLKNLAKNYTTTQKAVNDLDYSVIRNSKTELTETESGYCYADVEILSEWSDYIMKTYVDNGMQIPLTASGVVRSQIKKAAEETGHIEEIKQAVNGCFPDRGMYNFIMEFLFRGGYTHANAWFCMVPQYDVIGADFTSSYPAVMVRSKRFPVTPFMEIDLHNNGEEITDERINTMCVWFVADFFNIRQTTYHSIESKHKLISVDGGQFDNGRLIGAERIRVALTEIDYKIYCKYYKWESIRVLRAYAAHPGALPGYVLKPLKENYKIKARLKAQGLDGTTEYQNAKAVVNSFYGCMVTRLKYMVWGYDAETGEWESHLTKKHYSDLIKNQLLSPFWGIYVTAMARANLLNVLYEIDGGHKEPSAMYCDTDSIYMQDTPRNREIIAKWNDAVIAENTLFLEPEFRDIGAFDWIGGTDDKGNPQRYIFKTLGAKRYIKYHDGVTEVTVAGLPKGALERKIAQTFSYADDCYIAYENPKKKKGKIGYVSLSQLFDYFTDCMLLNCTESMKTRAVYSPQDYECTVIDADGHRELMKEKCGVAIVETSFQMKMEDVYKHLIESIMNERRFPI